MPRPIVAAARSRLLFSDIRQHRLIQARVGDDLLELCFLLAQLLDLARLARLQKTVLLLPAIKRLLFSAQLARNVRRRCAQLMLLHRRSNLLDRIPHSLHFKTSSQVQSCQKVSVKMARFSGLPSS
jgi:hypothetical protein